ncbi:UDP-N-acetylmuramate dehydrogenase [Psychromonas sp. MME2]|uniref:UDP-N-acetylmuramate dehydrogenase n=1 Tax=unclassified Psychromonas TaxID=2614957 RepID=UPI00339BAC7D
MIERNTSLKAFNTFAVEAQTQTLFHFYNSGQVNELLSLVKAAQQSNQPILILGAGSNILFCDDFDGLVIKVELKGIAIRESEDAYYLQVAAGENWHQLVSNCIEQGIDGLENLALIPGVVGAAPVQNIGAYGVEFKDFCESVEYLDLDSGEFITLSAAQCLFAYRDSIFKSAAMHNALITQVTMKLNKAWYAHSRYGVLNDLDANTPVTAKQIFQSVCDARNQKLPDPELLGNAGSFFKNPVVTQQQANHLLSIYPAMPHYPQANGEVKLAAGWLIEQAGLKGTQVGGAAVHQLQALVLINKDNASAQDVIQLAELVRAKVEDLFNVSLQHEVRFIGKRGETNLQQVLNHV